MTDQTLPGIVARNEPVTSAGQSKPSKRRLEYIAALAISALLLLLLVADHPNGAESAWVVGCSAALPIGLVIDWELRRRGLRP